MGVYIKNMKAPVTCSYCPLIGYDPNIEWNDGGRETQGAYICVLTHELIDNTKREDHCPLVSVPPHGRLGDLDILAKEVKDMAKEFPPDSIGAEWYILFAEFIKTAPTIIPAEPSEEQREYEAQVEAAQYCKMYEPSYDPETGAL